MFAYKNTSLSVKTFYGVTFNPGDIHTVSGYVNDPSMIRIKEKPKAATPKSSTTVKAPASGKSNQADSSKQADKKPLESKESEIEIEGGESKDGTNHN